MKSVLLTVFNFLNISCVYLGLHTGPKPADFDIYAKQFQVVSERSQKEIDKIPVQVDRLGYNLISGAGVIGECYYWPVNVIEIDPIFWALASDEEKWALTEHEFGHCVCRLPHTDEAAWTKKGYDQTPLKQSFDDGCPLSLMTPNIPALYCIRAHHTDYEIRMRYDCKYRGGIL
jgi:hypothetical protein